MLNHEELTICEEHIHFKDPNCEDCAKEWEQQTLTLPTLAPEEHAWVEERVGRRLSNEDAQLALREATIQAAWEDWTRGKS